MGRRYEGLAKLATVSAIIFGISLGLCGATFVVGTVFANNGDALMPLGILELLGMGVGLCGLLISGLAGLVNWITSIGQKDEDGE